MKILLITPYPPLRDGVANYSAQLAAALRRGGDEVEVLSPAPSAALSYEQLRTLRGLLRATRRARKAEKVIVQFQPEIFFSGMRLDLFILSWIGLAALFRLSGRVEVVVHELPVPGGGRAERLRREMLRWLWHQPSRLLVHTETERLQMASAGVPPERIGVVRHGERFERRSTATRLEARRRLEIDQDAYVFLSIGFLQPHKGFDRAARALQRLSAPNVRLDIVGDVRVYAPEHDLYVQLLRGLADDDPRVHLHEGYVSDLEFDEWIVASDAVVLPYRAIWSSGVAERAALYDRPVVVTSVGGLPEQARADGFVVRDAGQLVDSMAKLAGSEAREGFRATNGSPSERALATIRHRAEALRDWYDPFGELSGPPSTHQDGQDVLVEPLRLPDVPAKTGLKPIALAAVRRFTRWELEPIVKYVNSMRDILPRERTR